MIFTDSGIVLFKQDFREADRLISLYTREHGRVNLRLPSVNRAKGKLKAMSEPLTSANYRIYVRSGGAVGTITGGKIDHVFPHIRADLKKLPVALHCCELVHKITPLHQPNETKYLLLRDALTALNAGASTASLVPAFTLRLMNAAGYGLDKPVLQISTEFWRRIHQDAFEELVFTDAEDLLSLSKCTSVCRRFLDQYLNYPLNTLKGFALTDYDYAPEYTDPAEETSSPELAIAA